MYDKLRNGDKLYEHELLEILLFNAYPRRNTNPIAHALLDAFGTIKGVLNAEIDAICAVDGVGENVALYLKCIGECVQSASSAKGIAVLKCYEDCMKLVKIRLKGRTEEVLEIYCLDKSGRVNGIFSYTSNESNRVVLSSDTVARVIAGNSPAGVFIAHNHLGGGAEPSISDDVFTREVQVMCSMYNVNLYDHCIYAEGGDTYSYYNSGKLQKIKSDYSFEKLIGEQIKKDGLTR